MSKAPRDARGLIISAPGDLGDERPGTTADPRWLELERYCTVWIERDEAGALVAAHAVREGEWRQFIGALHQGERVEAHNERGEVVCTARVELDTVVFSADPGAFMVRLVRTRGVPSCSLDEIRRHGAMGNQQIGDAISRHRTLVAREVRGALRKAIDEAEVRGVEREDLMRSLMSMGEKKAP